SLVVRRLVFNDAFLKIDHFKRETQFHENKYKKKSILLTQKILDSIGNQNANYELKDVSILMFLSKSSEDINLITKAIKLLKHTKIPSDQINGIGAQLMRLTYILDQPDLGLKILQDKELADIFKSSYPKLILMNKLMTENRYEQVIDLFEKFLVQYNDTKGRKDNKFIFPHDQFVLVSIALYKMNSKEAFDKMVNIMKSIKIRRLEFVNTSLTRCFALAINQKEPEYGLKLVSKFDNLNVALGFNLSIIALSRMGFIEEALKIVQNVIDTKLDPDSSKFEGRFFRTTIKILDEQIKSCKFIESVNGKSKIKFDLLKSLIDNDKRYLKFDIQDLCQKPM
ncbi:unnamed protein product, partial [Brachionus calyciflorus]